MKIVVFAKSGSEAISVLICLRTVGEALIVRRGLITLKVLKALKLKSNAKNSITLYKIQ
jgi:hypothetical protein